MGINNYLSVLRMWYRFLMFSIRRSGWLPAFPSSLRFFNPICTFVNINTIHGPFVVVIGTGWFFLALVFFHYFRNMYIIVVMALVFFWAVEGALHVNWVKIVIGTACVVSGEKNCSCLAHVNGCRVCRLTDSPVPVAVAPRGECAPPHHRHRAGLAPTDSRGRGRRCRQPWSTKRLEKVSLALGMPELINGPFSGDFFSPKTPDENARKSPSPTLRPVNHQMMSWWCHS